MGWDNTIGNYCCTGSLPVRMSPDACTVVLAVIQVLREEFERDSTVNFDTDAVIPSFGLIGPELPAVQ
jgi:hypothetical protein